MARELEQAGFVNIRIEACECTYDYSSAEQWWNEMAEGGVPLVMARARMSEDAWSAFSDKCLKHLTQAVAGAPQLGSTAYLAYAQR